MAHAVLEDPKAPTLCGRTLGKHRHVCAFVRGSAEAHEILTPFVREGIARGERVLQIVDDTTRETQKARLATAGIPVDSAEKEGRLLLLGWRDAYLKDGYFDADRMLGMLGGYLDQRAADGLPLARGCATMEWALLGARGTENLLEYESRANIVSESRPDPLVCTYDVTRFDAGLILDILRVHPVAIIGGMVYENPYYVPPDIMLAELKARREKS